MNLRTKEEICYFINNSYLKINQKEKGLGSKKTEIKIPNYQSKKKRMLLSLLVFLFQKKAYFPNDEPKVSRIDFTKYIKPDDWIIYNVEEKIELIAIPKFVKEYKNCWEINLVAEFFKEDLQYGVKPMSIYVNLPTIGIGPIILGKNTNKFYQLGSVHWVYHDVVKEYDKLITNEKPAFEWKPLEVNL